MEKPVLMDLIFTFPFGSCSKTTKLRLYLSIVIGRINMFSQNGSFRNVSHVVQIPEKPDNHFGCFCLLLLKRLLLRQCCRYPIEMYCSFVEYILSFLTVTSYTRVSGVKFQKTGNQWYFDHLMKRPSVQWLCDVWLQFLCNADRRMSIIDLLSRKSGPNVTSG